MRMSSDVGRLLAEHLHRVRHSGRGLDRGGGAGLRVAAVQLVAGPVQGLLGPLRRRQGGFGRGLVVEERLVLLGGGFGGDVDGTLQDLARAAFDRPCCPELLHDGEEDDSLGIIVLHLGDVHGDALVALDVLHRHEDLGVALRGEAQVLVLGLGPGAASDDVTRAVRHGDLHPFPLGEDCSVLKTADSMRAKCLVMSS